MRSRRSIWILSGLLLLAGAWLLWQRGGARAPGQNSVAQKNSTAAPAVAAIAPAVAAPKIFASTNAAAAKTNSFSWRLANTKKSVGELKDDPRAILLENALIDTRLPLNFSIPRNLQSPGAPGAYIVQAHGAVNNSFRAMLAGAGAQIVSYIPNNAFLVTATADAANAIAADGFSVIPFEPYYKVPSALLAAVLKNQGRPFAIDELKVFAYPDTADELQAALPKMGLQIVATNSSPFGRGFTVLNVGDVAALAQMSVVQRVEPFYRRVHANDLSRVTTGVALDSVTTTNYLNLSGTNVIVEINDSGVDASHPDLTNRVFGVPAELVDTEGHGTHIAGIIAGSGAMSTTVGTNAEGSVTPATNFQFRGKAPLAKLLAMNFQDSDQNLQQTAVLTNALISNNSWGYGGDNSYDLEAASYDAATRDSLPGTTGSQPVLFVFAAGNDGNMDNGTGGNGDNNGFGGGPDTITSPATGKNVISVGAIEQHRNITNIVVSLNGTSNMVWQPLTDSGYSPIFSSTSPQVANYSSRGNVGIGTEGTFGRYKPDVVAPGTFVISTRSSEWDQNAYYHPTNDHPATITDIVEPYSLTELPLQFFVYKNSVQITIQASTTGYGTTNVPLPIYVWPGTNPNTTPPVLVGTNSVIMAPVPSNAEWQCGVSNTIGTELIYTLTVDVRTTNDLGNYDQVLEGMNDSLGGFYRYETGTSMSAGEVSGVLALMQDYFTNTLKAIPSPALLKALLINGARPFNTYSLQVQNAINFEGWGLINLPNSVPTNSAAGTNSVFFLDQNPTNALATGDSHTFLLTVANSNTLPLRVTLAWTDPPGNPAAAIKLVNNLDLIVTNLTSGTNSTATNVVYYGNDIPAGSIYNEVGSTNSPTLDNINNVENVFLPPLLAGTYSVTVLGREVNVNAVTAHTNNVVQDFALVISSGDGLNPGTITVTNMGIVSNPTNDQQITAVATTNAPLFNQFAGANTPLLGTNTIPAGANNGFATNAIITLGMTNQWHFYIVTNTLGYTNAAFVTFTPDTLAIPRMGVFAGTPANSTTPEADIDLYVSTNSALTNLDMNVISNCVLGFNGNSAALGRSGTEFVAYSNSALNDVYYVGVKAEDQEAAEYAFLPVFSAAPFSQTDSNGDEIVTGVPLPMDIPDGSPAHPGVGYVFALALQPMEVQSVVATEDITHQNIDDLVGTLNFNDIGDVLNNHDTAFDDSGIYHLVYDDSQYPLAGSQPSPGPGSLNSFVGQQAVGPWILTEVDDSLGQTGSVTGFTLTIQPHHDPTKGVVGVTLAPGEFYTTYVDVPVGATNLSIFATNITATAVQPVQLFVRYNVPPTQSNYDATATLNTTTPQGPAGFISISATNQPPLRPGRYYFSIFNPGGNTTQFVNYFATIGISLTGPTTLDFDSSGPLTLFDDAVMTSSIAVTNTDPIAAINVGIRVNHPRISDLVFHLISPDGTRYLLMENRGAYTTNGAGISYFTTNTVPANANGNNKEFDKTIDTGTTSGTISITYNFYTAPDQMVVYYGTTLTASNLMLDTGYTNNPPEPTGPHTSENTIPRTVTLTYPPPGATGTSTEITIIMNPGGNTNGAGTEWTYVVTSTLAKYSYLTFTEDTNLTKTPIKFAPTPFIPMPSTPTNLFTDSFETNAPGVYTNGQTFGDFTNEWTVTTNSVTITNDPANAEDGSNYLALGNGSISTVLPTVIGQPYILQYSFRGEDLTFVGGVLENSLVATTNWQTHYVYFTAAQSGTPITVQGTGSEALLDNVILTELPPSLYYLPEQSISPLVGTSPTGTWRMEVQDDRLGAYDTNNPPALLSWELQMVLASTNTPVPPVFTNSLVGTNIDMDELTTLTLTNTAVDANTNLTLTYSLINPPSWATIDPVTGIITLSPLEADGPTNVTITTIVIDNGTPLLSAEDSFTVTVNEVNTPPFFLIPNPPNLTNTALNTIIFTNTAGDSDIPANPLTYQLLISPVVTNAAISTNGIITWTPTVMQATNTYTFETIVTDTNVYALTNQSLSATNFFTVTVLPPLSPTNGVPVTNTVAAGSITWYLINVPSNSVIATNLLLFAGAPLNIWFSTNSPPTVTNSDDADLIPNATNGSSVLSTTSSPTNIVSGGVYYLGVQNTNSFSVTYAIEVEFGLLASGPPVFLYAPGTNTINELALLSVTNTATDADPATTLGYTLTVIVDTNGMTANGWTNNFANTTNTTPAISTNGIITWTPSELQGPGVYDFTTVVTNTETPSLSATNTFVVIVNESNTPPVLLFPTNTTVTNIVEGSPLTNLQAVATDSDIPTNTLTFAFVSATNPIGQAITNLTVSTNGLINWAPTGTNFLGTNFVSVSVTDYSPYAPANQHLSVTNTFKIVVWESNTAPFWVANPPTNTIAILTTLVVTNTASDTDSPPNTLTYKLISSPPTGVTIDTNTGIITWTPTSAQGNTTNIITTVVTDFNPYALTNQHLSATNSFVVIVLVPPFSATLAATAVTGTNAQLNGFATPNGSPAFAWFEWGTSSSYGNQTTNINVGSGKGVVFVTNLITPLSLPQVYHFRLDVSNGVAVAYGFDQILDVGGAVAWGDDGSGQTNVPAILTNTAVAVAGGLYDSLALGNNGRPIAWGDNSSGQTNVPASLTNAVAIASGQSFNLALRSNRRVTAWGYNGDGETNVPASLSNVVAVAAGGFHSLALRTNGTVISWGWNVANETNVPFGLSNVVAVAGGLYHSLALKNDGTVVAWGDNSLGETNVPAGLNAVVAVAAGNFYSLALKTNGTVVAWGNNADGETNVPAGLSNVVAIAAGSQHCLALENDGTVVSWGNDAYNQTNVPAGLNNMAAVAGGGYHSLALVAATPVNPSNNHPPLFLFSMVSHTLNVLATLTVTNTAKDTDLPAQTLAYTLSNPPVNVNINFTNGIITFTPATAQLGTNIITTIVTDNGTPPLSATNSFIVVVYEVNTPPVLTLPADTNIDELVAFTNTATATDSDIPANPLTFALVSGPVGLAVSTNGVITWTPTEAQGPGTNTVAISVTDTNVFALTNQSLSVTNSFQIIVREVNSAPFWTTNPLPNQTVFALSNLTVNAAATDTDLPPNTLSYTLSTPVVGPNLPLINTNTGVITWTPTAAQGNTTNTFTVIVTDNGVPPLSATNSFIVIINPALMPPFSATLPATAVTGTNAQLNGFATPNGSPSVAWFEWGASRYHGNATAPVNVGGAYGVVYVSNSISGLIAGQSYHYCLVVSNALAVVRGADQEFSEGMAVAWGDNTFGQTNVPPGLSNVVAVAGGGYHSLALLNDGTVSAWGLDNDGQSDVPPGLSNVVAVAGGGSHSLALLNDGTVTAWGDDISAQLDVPVGLANVVAVAGGGNHSLALKNDGTVVAWGDDTYGQTDVPAGLGNVVAVAGGGNHSLALKNDGTVVAWGYNVDGETNVPAGLSNVVAVAAGGFHSLALKTNGMVVAWGYSLNGETNVPAGLSNVVAVAGGRNHSLALRTDGAVVAWGLDNFGQTNVPSGLTNVVAVTGGIYHSMALTSALTNPPVIPTIASISKTANGFLLQWNAPVNEAFQVQWTTNLAPAIIWTVFPNTITSTNGTFFFTDTNAPLVMKFYELILLP